jgi:hypothetical protein
MNRSTLVISLATVLSISCTAAFASRQTALVFVLLMCIPIVCCGLVGAISYRARRLPWKGLGAGLVLSIPVLACIMATTYISTGRFDYVQRWDYQNHIEQANSTLKQDQSDLAKYQGLASISKEGLRAAKGPYRVPVQLARGGFTEKTFQAHPTAAKFLASETAKVENYYRDDFLTMTAYRTEAQQRLATPFATNFVHLIPISAIFGLFIFATLSVSAIMGFVPAVLGKTILASAQKGTA